MIHAELIFDSNWSIDYSKAELSRRNNILIVSSSLEKLSAENTELFIKILNSRYSYNISDVAPYHFYVDVDGKIYKSKEDILKVNPTSELKGFDNDLIIMVMNQDIIKMPSEQKQSLVELVGELSNKYQISSNRISFYPTKYAESPGSGDIIKNIIKEVIIYKNNLNKINYICENADDKNPYVSEYLGIIKTDENCYLMKDLSVKFGVREDILRGINPQISNEPEPGQLIFYPKTTVVKIQEISDYMKKHANKYYELSKIKVEE